MINRITIRSFKSLRDVTVELSPVTVFVGRSGSGKSNFISAIDFLRRWLIPQERQQLQQKYRKGGDIVFALMPEAFIEFDVDFQIAGYGEVFTYSLKLRPSEWHANPESESLRYGKQIIFEQRRDTKKRNQTAWQIEPRVVPIPPAGPSALGRIPSIDLVADAYSALTVGIGVHRFPFDVLLTNGKNQRNSSGALSLSDDADNFLGVLAAITGNAGMRQQVDAASRQVNSTIESVRLDSIQNPTQAIAGHKMGDKTLSLELDQESDGFRRFFAHILALYQATAKQTLIFEEPENGIFPGALSVLADELNAAPAAGRGQVLLTTHSPRLLDHFSADQIRVVELVDFETRIGRLAEEQRQALEADLITPGELLTVDPARRAELP